MREKTKAYMAGIFDAEGCVGVYSFIRDGQEKYQAVIRMPNKSLDLMKWIVRNFGGTFTKRTFPRKGYRTSDGYEWHIYDQKHLARFLSSILPYLILKRKQAELVIGYTEMFWQYDPSARKRVVDKVKKLKRERVTTDMLDSSSLGPKTIAPYIAGFVDGEGTFYRSRTGGSYIKAGNTQSVVIEMIHEKFPGHMTSSKLPSGKVFHTWWIFKTKMEKFILAVLPYLVIKKEQAKVLLNFVRMAEDTV